MGHLSCQPFKSKDHTLFILVSLVPGTEAGAINVCWLNERAMSLEMYIGSILKLLNLNDHLDHLGSVFKIPFVQAAP